jgi:DNA repair exonuclease SbcCD ATPase subunit
MRFITFKRLEGKNFLSFGDTPVTIDLRPGVNAIIGTNLDKEDSKNGAGKSSVTELLYYSLYGTTLREISKDYIENSVTKKRCEVSLEFQTNSNGVFDTYKIVRKLNPTKCQLFKNNEDITRSTLAKTNALIQEVIHTPATVFQNSVIMSANNALPFMALPKTDKRKFIESVLGLEIFTEMVLKARDDYSIAKKDYEIAYTKFEQTKNELDFNQSQFDNYENIKKERSDKLKDKKRTLLTDIQNLKAKIVVSDNLTIENDKKQIEYFDQELLKLGDKKTAIQSKINIIQAEVSSENKQIKQLQTNKDKCPTCSREYSEEHVDHVSKLISKHNSTIEKFAEAETKLKNALEDLDKEIVSFQAGKKICNENIVQVTQLLNENRSFELSINHLTANLKDVEEEIEIANREQNNELKGKIANLNSTTQDLQQKVDKLNNELNVLETVKFVISEEGIKSFIVKKILKVLNSRLAFYLKKLEANCLCKFNEFFDEEIIDESSNQKSYFNFSGGERKRIDLACLFAFADIRRLQGDVNFSTVFYDELLDSSLDDKGVQLTLKILRERFQENNESCYIITHRGPEVTTKAEHTIHVVKRNGVSSVQC